MELDDLKHINRIALMSLDIADQKLLKHLSFIGEIYCRSYVYGTKSIVLHFPFFDKEHIRNFEIYIKFLDHALQIYDHNNIDDWDGCFLLNFFDSKSERLQFRETIADISKWGSEPFSCYTSNNTFFPIFRSSELVELSNIKNNLPLYKMVKKRELITHPVIIDLDNKNIYLQERNKSLESFENGIFRDFRLDSNNDTDYLNQIFNEINSNCCNRQITVLYPYYSNIHTLLIRADVNNFQLVFSNRFRIREFKEIADRDLIILPNEIHNEIAPLIDYTPYFEIIQTNAEKRTFELLRDILEDWQTLDLNKYLYPFPKYFLMLICKGESLDYWMLVFERCYPFIVDRPIYNSIMELFRQVYELDWSSTLIKAENRINFIFPDLNANNNRSRLLREPYNIFKQYQCKLSLTTTFSGQVIENSKNYILNCFDVNYILNGLTENNDFDVKVVVPDFLYYNVNPFGLYQLFNYQFLSYFTKTRVEIFPELGSYKDDCESLKKRLLNSCRRDFKRYVESISEDINSELPLDGGGRYVFDEILDELEEAEAEKNRRMQQNRYQEPVKIIATLVNDSISLFPEEQVYIMRENFLKIKAVDLTEKDLFLNITKIKNIIKNAFLVQLEYIPKSVRYFRYELYLKGDAFNKLKRIGLKINGEDYFNNSYLASSKQFEFETFKLPRRDDRQLICDFLNIDPADMQIAYIAKYKSNKDFKRLYSQIIDFLIDGKHLHVTNSEFVKQHIIDMFNSNKVDVSDEYDVEEFAVNIVNNILNRLIDYLEPIKNLKYEIES